MDEKNIFSHNLKYQMELNNKSRQDLSTALGISYFTITSWVNGTKYPRMDKVEMLAQYFGCQKSDLIEERSLTSPAPQPTIPTAKNIIPMPEMRKIPLLGTIACGEPILAVENIAEYVDIPNHIPADFALTCKGDSMINARIFNGDIVYIRQQESVENGEIAAVLIGNEATLKRVRLFDDHIVLEPENPMYRPMVYWGEDMNTVRIIGKAVAFTAPVV